MRTALYSLPSPHLCLLTLLTQVPEVPLRLLELLNTEFFRAFDHQREFRTLDVTMHIATENDSRPRIGINNPFCSQLIKQY
jgi:hypothetical protein